ncbi:tRNA pseudouridine32 synthase / 23S rRNA pseudouridine746 synthase [Chishuiella changwenlii]|uniref:RNA pseudouridine synthase n=1 Tax=Chishuiella changwenlii TaxID=1434701 RepID=A0A1M7AEQ2_9FLAO|nr:RluA family pseudouridine synthase [Chishuiella changwenlii]GGE90098.1 RNA pseudouridine synthase [Chishuiella changwenlii]SHL41192.1 tRNA pseudouridine32 synthase / 23S rRNA pseudouridine746 synthase [Chishuiella changwenlii]
MSQYFHHFKQSISNLDIPVLFDYPFYYEPKEIAKLACKEVQDYLENQTDFEHNFGLLNDTSSIPIGKMFGVLVVKNKLNEIGYLAAVSGKLANSNVHLYFVPPVFDMLHKDGFFLEQEERLNEINRILEKLESDSSYLNLKQEWLNFDKNSTQKIVDAKLLLKTNKADRKKQRSVIITTLNVEDAEEFEADLVKQSLRDKYEFRKLTEEIETQKIAFLNEIESYESKISELKEERKIKSKLLQNQLFEQYQFTNKFNKNKSLKSIFEQTVFQKPPAGAGECAAPKLLQFAFLNQLEPICMAEFWWGDSPKSEVRKHQHFYPACTGKCEPILGHMLDGIELEENLLLKQNSDVDQLEIIYKDSELIVINKPEEFLSVPGIEIKDSVYFRIKSLYPNATGPLIVHRLDMATSGLLVLALNKESHKALQQQFIKRKIKKRYVALLDGNINNDKGVINLPLRVDLDDRPRQMVCEEHGKTAKTEYEVIKRKDNKTLVHFYPITGRTHQLRMHASHVLGLNSPIIGDDLYGKKANRLHLHAEYLELVHPTTKEIMKFQVDANFNL